MMKAWLQIHSENMLCLFFFDKFRCEFLLFLSWVATLLLVTIHITSNEKSFDLATPFVKAILRGDSGGQGFHHSVNFFSDFQLHRSKENQNSGTEIFFEMQRYRKNSGN